MDDRLCEHSCGGGSVTGNVVGRGGDFTDELGTLVLERVIYFDFTRDGHTIVGDRRCAELLVEHDVAALGTERYFDGIGNCVYAGFQRFARLGRT